jgi:hypothetical protein
MRAHRFIMGLANGNPLQVDHDDHNGLNNRRRNLDIVDNRGNQENRRDQSKYGPGIRRVASGRYVAAARTPGKQNHIGTFDTRKEAEEARDIFLEEFYEAEAANGNVLRLYEPKKLPDGTLDIEWYFDN